MRLETVVDSIFVKMDVTPIRTTVTRIIRQSVHQVPTEVDEVLTTEAEVRLLEQIGERPGTLVNEYFYSIINDGYRLGLSEMSRSLATMEKDGLIERVDPESRVFYKLAEGGRIALNISAPKE